MTVVNPPAKVLVSGASGFIAIWVVRSLLERGYAVRGTVRSHEKGKYLKEMFKEYGDKFEAVVVKDISSDGAFDEAVQGVDAIEHTASPFHTKADDPKEVIDPAVKGTVGILQAALKNGSSVQRIVITSSVAAVRSVLSHHKVFTEADFNDEAVETVEKDGKKASGQVKYEASKTLAEKAAWSFYHKYKESIKWDLVVLNPPYVFGPVIHQVKEPSSLNTSAAEWYEKVVKQKHAEESAEPASYIDVRDLAEAHVRALEKPEAGGERFIVNAGLFSWKNWQDAANNKHPQRPSTSKAVYANDKSTEVLGLNYRTMEETARDSLTAFEAKGW